MKPDLPLDRSAEKPTPRALSPGAVKRAQGCLLGQLAGDALGSLVEFRHSADIRAEYPGGVRALSDGGTWKTIAGQPTDDSEMALALARSILNMGRYDAVDAARRRANAPEPGLPTGKRALHHGHSRSRCGGPGAQTSLAADPNLGAGRQG